VSLSCIISQFNVFVVMLSLFDLSIFLYLLFFFFFSSRRRHTRSKRDWSSDVCSSDLGSTYFINGFCLDMPWQFRLSCRLSRRNLSLTTLKYISHNDFSNFVCLNCRSFHCRFNCFTASLLSP